MSFTNLTQESLLENFGEEMLSQLKSALSENKERLFTLRASIYTPLFKAKRYQDACRVVSLFTSIKTDSALLYRDQANCLARLKDFNAASHVIMSAIELSPRDLTLVALALQIHLQAKAPEKGVELALSYQEDWIAHAQLNYLSMTVLYRAKHEKGATKAARSILSNHFDDNDRVAAASGVLLSYVCVSDVLVALNELDFEDISNHAGVLFEFARAKLLKNQYDQSALPLLLKCVQLDPEHYRALDLLGRLYDKLGQIELACQSFQRIPERLLSDSMQLKLADIYANLSQYDAAIKLYQTQIKLKPNNAAIRRSYISVLMLAGDTQKARENYQQWLSLRQLSLPDHFMQGVESIFSNPANGKISKHCIDWIYQTLEQNQCQPMNREQWEAELSRVNQLDHFILDWMECQPDKTDEMKPLFNRVEQAASKLRQALSEGKGAFIASAHIGVLYGGPFTLVKEQFDAAWIASVPDLGESQHNGSLISTTTTSENKIGREVIKALRHNKVVAIACDGGKVQSKQTYPFFNQQISLSDFIPRYTYKTGVRSFWPKLIWTGEHVDIELIELPLPTKGEPMDSYVARWITSFIDELKAVLLNHSTSLRASGGLWTKIRK